MAETLRVAVTSDAAAGFAQLEAKMREEYLFSAVAAMANVIYEEVVLNVTVEGRLGIGRKTGNLASSIYRAYIPEESTADLKVYHISWNKRKAPHGHFLEYGTSRQPAKPFVRPANDHAPRAVTAGQERLAERFGEGL